MRFSLPSIHFSLISSDTQQRHFKVNFTAIKNKKSKQECVCMHMLVVPMNRKRCSRYGPYYNGKRRNMQVTLIFLDTGTFNIFSFTDFSTVAK